MSVGRQDWANSPETLIVLLAGRGDRQAFQELLRRRQSRIRNLMRRLCGDAVLADDLAQQVCIQMWRSMGQLTQPQAFPGWLKRLAVNIWLQHLRRGDPLSDSAAIEDFDAAAPGSIGEAIDIDRALSMLPSAARLCIVLSYHERMSHPEIAETTGFALGTVKSHIRRGTERLQVLLADYARPAKTGVNS